MSGSPQGGTYTIQNNLGDVCNLWKGSRPIEAQPETFQWPAQGDKMSLRGSRKHVGAPLHSHTRNPRCNRKVVVWSDTWQSGFRENKMHKYHKRAQYTCKTSRIKSKQKANLLPIRFNSIMLLLFLQRYLR